MTKLLLSLVAIGVSAVAAFADSPPGPGPNNPCLIRPGSGVQGTVDRGPIRPIVRPGETNTAPMVNTEIVVKDAAGKVVARTKTDKDGYYEFALPPGKYTLVGPRNGIMPGNWKQDVEVTKTWVRVNIHIDSGIRTPVRPQPVAPTPTGVKHSIDVDNVPASLTVNVGDVIVFKSRLVGAKFAGWKLDANGVTLVREALIRIFPPQLVVWTEGKGKLEVLYRDHVGGQVRSKFIDLEVKK